MVTQERPEDGRTAPEGAKQSGAPPAGANLLREEWLKAWGNSFQLAVAGCTAGRSDPSTEATRTRRYGKTCGFVLSASTETIPAPHNHQSSDDTGQMIVDLEKAPSQRWRRRPSDETGQPSCEVSKLKTRTCRDRAPIIPQRTAGDRTAKAIMTHLGWRKRLLSLHRDNASALCARGRGTFVDRTGTEGGQGCARGRAEGGSPRPFHRTRQVDQAAALRSKFAWITSKGIHTLPSSARSTMPHSDKAETSS